MATNGPAVIVMARMPRPGEGKSRLRPSLPDEACLQLQKAFLRDTVDVALESELGQVYLAYTPEDAREEVEAGLGDRVVGIAQQGEDLGARMLAALRHVTACGHAPLVMIGTDTPFLRPDHLRAALAALVEADVCLGPSDDGGYYLLACRAPHAQLFAGIAWGTAGVLDTTLRIAAESGLRSKLIETLYDVDTVEDLERLRADFGEPVMAQREARRTIEALRT